MEYQVVVSPKAYEQILDCISFVANVSKEAAVSLYNDIKDAINSLKSMPNRCPIVEFLKYSFGVNRGLFLKDGRYIIIFRVEGPRVLINYFADTRKKEYSGIF